MKNKKIVLFKKLIDDQKKNNFLNLSNLQIENLVESSRDFCLFHSYASQSKWLKLIRKNTKFKVSNIPLDKCKDWSFNKKGFFVHKSNEFFFLQGLRIENTSFREIQKSGWDQPILTQVGYKGGIVGIIRKKFYGLPHYLLESKIEPGNYKKAQISPCYQATYSNIYKKHGGRSPHFTDIFLNKTKNKVLFKQWFSEDGGRLHLKRNLGIIVEVKSPIKLPNNKFRWFSLYQIKKMIRYENAFINPHVRSLISFLN